jgi:periplasmic protein TonB
VRMLAAAAIVLLIVLAGHTLASPQNPPTTAAPPPATTPNPFDDPSLSHAGDKGLIHPVVRREVKPKYTKNAMKAKIDGVVQLECIVKADGTVGEVRVTQSLDKLLGLDNEAIKALKKWTFTPGRKNDVAVPVVVEVETAFWVLK